MCTRGFPCQPLTFWSKDRNGDRDGDGDGKGGEGEAKYRAAYFTEYGVKVWHHGDFVRMNPATGGMVMLGRSDGVLKPGGVRFGSAEIYNVLSGWFAGEVADAVCVGRRRGGDADEVVVLFVVMCAGKEFGAGVGGVGERIRGVVRRELSARHVPRWVEECGPGGVPVTVNGKKYVEWLPLFSLLWFWIWGV